MYKENCAAFSGVFKIGLAELWQFARDNDKQLVVISTIFIALFTVILGTYTVRLANATNALVTDAKSATQWQLRAYVTGRFKHLNSFDETIRASAKFKIKNIGKTPARSVSTRADIFVVPKPLPENYVFPLIGTPNPISIVMFPRQSFNCDVTASTLFTAEELSAVRENTAQIYLVAEIFYDDVFGDPHRTFVPVFVFADESSLDRITTNYGRADLHLTFGTAPGTVES